MLFGFPFLFAEFAAVGSVNLPGKANLAQCARTAHLGVRVGNSCKFRHPDCFSSGQTDGDGILLVTFLLLLTKFVWNKFERVLLGLLVF